MSDWEDRAACRGKDTDLFYPEDGSRRGTPAGVNVWRRAKRVCAQCPVRQECLEDVLSYEEPRYQPTRGNWSRPLPHGVWGGATPKERHAGNIKHYRVKELITVGKTARKFRYKRLICADDPSCRGCRPVPERVRMLEELFVAQVHRRGLLTKDEEVA